MADLIERLLRAAKNAEDTLGWLANMEDSDCTPIWETQAEFDEDAQAIREAATSLSQALARIEELEKALEWYGEQARLCRLIHSEGDSGRHALAGDGGKRARSILPATPIDGSKG